MTQIDVKILARKAKIEIAIDRILHNIEYLNDNQIAFLLMTLGSEKRKREEKNE